jgi:hypothetical protein
MKRARGSSFGFWAITLVAVVAGGVACGGSGDDDGAGDGNAGEDGSGGTPPGSGGSDGQPSAGESGNTGGSGATGSAGTGSGATGGGASAGRAGSSSSAGSGVTIPSDTDELLEQIEEACETDCDAQFALECAPANSNSLTCQLSCAAQTVQIGDFCLAEYRDYVECRGSGGYDCVNTYPYQRSTCAAQQVAFTTCTQHIGCKRYCKKAIDDGCIDTTFDACVDSCLAEGEALPDDCSYYSETVAYCQATNVTECTENGLTTPAACSYQVLTIAECISDDSADLCTGWCWAADRLGCGGDDCAGECAGKLANETCGAAWQELLDCGLFFGDAACDTESFVANGICDSEVQAYETCVNGPVEEDP